MECRKAETKDLADIMLLIDKAKNILKRQGINKWQIDYPDVENVESDIEFGEGYVLVDDENVTGYACISFEGEKSYKDVDGRWKSIDSYAAIERIVIDDSYKEQGLSSELLKHAEDLCQKHGISSVKIDTDSENDVMKQVLMQNGYEDCGVIDSGKIVYEKVL